MRGKKRVRVSLAILMVFVTVSACLNENDTVVVPKRLETFDYGSVTLTDGRLKQKWDEVRSYYLNIPTDNMLYEYRVRTGRPNPPGKQLEGWYIQLVGYSLNEWISAFSRMYAVTGDTAYRDKADELVAGWWECFNRAPGGLMWHNSVYAVKRWMDALMDHYEYANDEESLNKLSKLIQWADNTLETSRVFGDNGSEWYTLSESLYRAYQLTGKDKYRESAQAWEYTEYWDLFVKNLDPLAKKPEAGMNTQYLHAYSHLNSFNSAAEAYRVKGDAYYLEAMKKAYEWVRDTQLFATGGYGPGLEHFMPLENIVADLQTGHASFETGAQWIATNFTRNLIAFTGDARYGDWMEKLYYNGLLAALPMKSDGVAMSYFDYNLNGGKKAYGWRGQDLAWTSGASTLPLDVTELHRAIYFHDNANIYVNLFTPSVLTWKRNHNDIRIEQQTAYPESEVVELNISVTSPEKFAVKFRVPEWIAEPVKAFVNGKEVKVKPDESHWVAVTRKWKTGDKLTIRLPMALWASRLGLQSQLPAAIMFGPLAMPVAAEKFESLGKIDLDKLNEAFIRIGDNRPEYRLHSDKSIRIKPFYDYRQDELYYMYLQ